MRARTHALMCTVPWLWQVTGQGCKGTESFGLSDRTSGAGLNCCMSLRKQSINLYCVFSGGSHPLPYLFLICETGKSTSNAPWLIKHSVKAFKNVFGEKKEMTKNIVRLRRGRLLQHPTLTQMSLSTRPYSHEVLSFSSMGSHASQCLRLLLRTRAFETSSMINVTRFKVGAISWILRFVEMKWHNVWGWF